MISIRSVIGALRKTLKICESVLVRKVDVSGTSKGGIGLGLRDQNVLVVRSHRSTERDRRNAMSAAGVSKSSTAAL
jgi:hypothetical protein